MVTLILNISKISSYFNTSIRYLQAGLTFNHKTTMPATLSVGKCIQDINKLDIYVS